MISEVKAKRTDTTLDLSQSEEALVYVVTGSVVQGDDGGGKPTGKES